ncbi:MAG: hypothetical protein AAF676_16175 [Pseudomonadota bacterium]
MAADVAQVTELDVAVEDAVAAIVRLREAADGAGDDERDRLARGAARIDEALAQAVRAIHGSDERD